MSPSPRRTCSRYFPGPQLQGFSYSLVHLLEGSREQVARAHSDVDISVLIRGHNLNDDVPGGALQIRCGRGSKVLTRRNPVGDYDTRQSSHR